MIEFYDKKSIIKMFCIQCFYVKLNIINFTAKDKYFMQHTLNKFNYDVSSVDGKKPFLNFAIVSSCMFVTCNDIPSARFYCSYKEIG